MNRQYYFDQFEIKIGLFYRLRGILITGVFLLFACGIADAGKPLSDAAIRKLIADRPQYSHGAPPLVLANLIGQLEGAFDGIGDLKLKGDVAFALGDYYRKVLDAENSIKYFAKAESLYKRSEEWALYARAVKAYCSVNMLAGRIDIIEPALKECLAISKEHDLGYSVLEPLQELTVHLSYTVGNYSEAVKYGEMFIDSLKKYEHLGITEKRFGYIKKFDAAVVDLELGHSYLELGVLDKASFYLQKAKSFFLSRGYSDKLIRVYGHLAVLEGYQNQPDSLIAYLNQFDHHRDEYRAILSKILYDVPGLTRDLHTLNEAYLQSQKDLAEASERNRYVLAILGLAFVLLLVVFWARGESRNDRNRINDLLTRDFERSQKLNEEKTRYFSILSHELRTPIFAITGLAKLLQHPVNNTRDNIEAIINSGNHLLHLINNVLHHSKLEELGQVILEDVDFELLQALNEAMQATSYLASQKNVYVIFKNQLSGPQHLSGDKQKLVQILVNLISNAIRYSNSNGKVELSVSGAAASDAERAFHFSVCDYGIGIESAQIPILFDYRNTSYSLESTGDNSLRGVGIGLFVVANFIKAMGSEILVESKPGEGSNFHFDLKFRLCRQTQIVKPSRFSNDIKVMVVDDIKINLIVTQKTLSNIGIKCITATDADPVVEMIIRENIDLVLMDLNMPLINGYDLSKAIRQAGISIPIIAHTAVIKENIDHQALADAQIHDYLIKPYPIEELKEKLAKYLNITI